MNGLVRDFADLEDGVPLDQFLEALQLLAKTLPEGGRNSMVRARGDDVFGHSIQVSFLRPETSEERARADRYRTATSCKVAA
jgi:hypothetical protein